MKLTNLNSDNLATIENMDNHFYFPRFMLMINAKTYSFSCSIEIKTKTKSGFLDSVWHPMFSERSSNSILYYSKPFVTMRLSKVHAVNLLFEKFYIYLGIN